MSDVINIREKALVVKNATQEGENTAERVGGLFVAVAEKLAEIPTSTELEDKVKDIIDDIDMSQYAPAYDDTAIKEKIAELGEAVTEANNTIVSQTSRLDGITEEINTKAASVQSNLDKEVEAIGTHISDLTSKYGNLAGQYTTITNRVGALELQVASIEGGGGSQDPEALIATINAAVDNKVASLDLETVYSKTNDVGKILEWMYSGMKESASASKTYAELVSAAKNNTLGNSAIAGLQTQIDNLGDTYVATSQLNTKVNDAIASMVQSVDPNASVTSIINQVGTNKGNISSIISRVSSLEGAGYLSETDIVNALGDSRTNIYSSVNSLANTAATGALAQLGPNTIASALAQATDEEAIAALQAKFGSTIEEGGIDNLISERLKAYATGTELQQVASTASSNSSAISSLEQRTRVLEDGNFVSSSEVWNIVKNNVEDTISSAGYVSTSDFNNAKQVLQSSIDSKTTSSWVNTQLESYLTQASFEAITGLSTTEANVVSGLRTRVKNVEDGYVSQAALLTSVEDKFFTKYQSGIVSQATLTNAMAGLVAEKTLKDDYVAKASVITSINESGESGVTINADKINIAGITIQSSQVSGINELIANTIKSTTIEANSITSASGTTGNRSIINIDGGEFFQSKFNGDVGNLWVAFNSDGTGSLANGSISWDSNGGMRIKGSNTNSVLDATGGDFTFYSTESDAETSLTTIGYYGIDVNAHNGASSKLDDQGLTLDAANIKMTNGYLEVYDLSDRNNASLVIDSLGNIDANGTLDVGGKTTVGGTLTVGSHTSINGDLDVVNIITASEIDVDNISPSNSSNVVVDSNLVIHGTVTTEDDTIIGGRLIANSIQSEGDMRIETGSASKIYIDAYDALSINSKGNMAITSDLNINNTAEEEITFYSQRLQSNVNLTVTSDERKKDIINPVEAPIESIANVRVVDYKLKDSKSDRVSLGSIAQDWQNIYPNAITTDKDGFLGMDYSSIALASAVEAAKEIVKLKAENAELKERLAAIESKLEKLVN